MNAAMTLAPNSFGRLAQDATESAATRLADERGYLRRVALKRLRDEHLAEDAVQDTLVAAMQAIGRFEGRASLRTWLVAILRNKINDLLGRGQHEISGMDASLETPSDEDGSEEFYDERGGWHPGSAPHSWDDPAQAAQNRQFWQVLESCLAELPPRSAEVFRLREIQGESIADICKQLSISASNCSVVLFRARSHLRAALETRWFAASPRQPLAR